MIGLRTKYVPGDGFTFVWDGKPEEMDEDEYWQILDSSLAVAIMTLYTARADGNKGFAKMYANRLATMVGRMIEEDALDGAEIGVKHG